MHGTILFMDITNTAEPISEDSLHAFYAYAVLPQFGIDQTQIKWESAEALGGDESLHRFEVDRQTYALIFEDYDGLGRNDAFIQDKVLQDGKSYEFVEPVSSSGSAQTYDGFRLPSPSRYCPNITGSFTLIRFIDQPT